MFAIDDKWVWDFWLAHEDGRWHMYYLQAPKSLGEPERRHWNVTQGHAVSRDLVNWTNLRTCFTPSPEPAWDDYTTWTGSVVKDDKGTWHLFYTGTCRREEGRKQRIGHATSTDLHSWRRVNDGLALDLDPVLYEQYEENRWKDQAMRDPWVMRSPNGDGWLMYFTARVSETEDINAGGAIGLARSRDLYCWELLPPVYSGSFGQLEVPQVLRIDKTWYCLFCTCSQDWSKEYSEANPEFPVTGTHYLMAESCLGPWKVADGPFLDGASSPYRYAGKIVEHDGRLMYLGFLNYDEHDRFVGGVSDPVSVLRHADGKLELLPE